MRVELTGLDQYRQLIGDLSGRRVQAAVATAVTRTAVAVRADALAGLRSSLHRPTPYTQKQLKYTVATADYPVAAVGFNVQAIQDVYGNVVRFEDSLMGDTPAAKYLAPNIEGGQRRLKRMEVALRAAGALPMGWFAVPGDGAKIDTYGNVSSGQVIQILSQLRITLLSGFTRNMSWDARSAIRAQKKAGGRFFVVPPGGQIQPGVYQREFFGRNITPVFIFVRSVRYTPRYRFGAITERTATRVLPVQVTRALKEQIDRAAKAAGAKGAA